MEAEEGHDHAEDATDTGAVPAPVEEGAADDPRTDTAIVAAAEPDAPGVQKPDAPAVRKGDLAPDLDVFSISDDQNVGSGREVCQRISFINAPVPQVAVGFHSLDLGWEHIRAIAFTSEEHYESFNVHLNASAEIETFGGKNPNVDTKLKGGKLAWLRALPNDPNVQMGRCTFGQAYNKGYQLPLGNSSPVKFQRKTFSSPPTVLAWISCMDFSKAYNWRLKVYASDVTTEGFNIHADTWSNCILYKADVTWIALAEDQMPGMRTGQYSIADVRDTSKWVNENSGSVAFKKPFDTKPPKVVAGLNYVEMGCGRGFRVKMDTKADKENLNWTINAGGDSHLYGAGAAFVAYDPVSTASVMSDQGC